MSANDPKRAPALLSSSDRRDLPTMVARLRKSTRHIRPRATSEKLACPGRSWPLRRATSVDGRWLAQTWSSCRPAN